MDFDLNTNDREKNLDVLEDFVENPYCDFYHIVCRKCFDWSPSCVAFLAVT